VARALSVDEIEEVAEVPEPRYEGVLLFAGDGGNKVYGFDSARGSEIIEGDWIGLARNEVISHGQKEPHTLARLGLADRERMMAGRRRKGTVFAIVRLDSDCIAETQVTVKEIVSSEEESYDSRSSPNSASMSGSNELGSAPSGAACSWRKKR
jgi:hypothetical protein